MVNEEIRLLAQNKMLTLEPVVDDINIFVLETKIVEKIKKSRSWIFLLLRV